MNAEEAIQHYIKSGVQHDQAYVIDGKPDIAGVGLREGMPTLIRRPKLRQHTDSAPTLLKRLRRSPGSRLNKGWPPPRWSHGR